MCVYMCVYIYIYIYIYTHDHEARDDVVDGLAHQVVEVRHQLAPSADLLPARPITL